jgi:AmiR/NasT family two-component response regulator
VILMTAFGTPELLDHARQLGAVAIVHKPFDLAEVSDLAWQVSHGRNP